MPETKSVGVKEMYKVFRRDNPNLNIPYMLYKEIIFTGNKLATEKVLRGKAVKLGPNIGEVRVVKVNRKFEVDDEGNLKGATVDLITTKALKEQGIDKKVYYTDPYYRWWWGKRNCSVFGKVIYKFRPTTGAGGTREKLKKVLKDPLNHSRFRPL